MTYYALYDPQFDGFKAGYASKDLTNLIKESSERIIELSQSDEEPLSFNSDPIDVIESYSYEIRIINEDDYNKINESNELFLSSVVNGVNDGRKLELK